MVPVPAVDKDAPLPTVNAPCVLDPLVRPLNGIVRRLVFCELAPIIVQTLLEVQA
jgi:hypothetical protein